MGRAKHQMEWNEERKRERLKEEAENLESFCPSCGRPINADNIEYYRTAGQCKPGCDRE